MENSIKNRDQVIKLRNSVRDSSDENIQDMKDAIVDLINNLTELNLSQDSLNNWISKLEKYIDLYDRILYSEITIHISKKLSDNEYNSYVNSLVQNMDRVLEFSKNQSNGISEQNRKIILKLWDHISLVNNQYRVFYTSEKEIHKAIDPEVEKIKKDLAESRNELERAKYDLEQIKKDIYAQLIGIVGIFVAIAFVMFGGMSLMNNLFDYSNLKDVPLFPMLSGASLIGIVILCSLYYFILLVSKVSGSSISNSYDNMPKSLKVVLIGLACAGGFFLICSYSNLNKPIIPDIFLTK